MKSGRPPSLPIALLMHCVPGNEPLIGDLLEEWHERSDAWLWRQVLLAVFSGAVLHARMEPRLTAEKALVTTGMLALLGFYTLVVATMMNRVIALSNAWLPRTGHYQDLQFYFIVPGFCGAVLMGRMIGHLHHNHRVLSVLGCSLTATSAACLNIYLFVPDALLQPLVPHAATQIALGMLFVAGLFFGIGSRASCEPQPSS